MNSARAAFWYYQADCIHHLGFISCPADLDLFIKNMLSPEDGFNYYAYVFIYVDDVMVVYHDDENVLRRIDKYFNLKPSSIGEPDIYLGEKLNKMRFKNVVWEWSNIPARYVKELVANVEKYLVELNDARWKLPKKKN